MNTYSYYAGEKDCARIVETALWVLENTGCELHHADARRLLAAAGCRVEGTRVRIPATLVREAIASVPREIAIYDREGQPALTLSAHSEETYFSAGIADQNRIDIKTGKKRPTTKWDAADAAVVVDALSHVQVACGLSCVADCPEQLADLWEAKMMLENTKKPFMLWNFEKANIDAQVAMCAAVAGSREAFLSKPFVICTECATSPLGHSEEAMEKFLYICELGLPIAYIGAPSIGGTGPMTAAGSFAVSLADSFVGLVLSQLIRRGNPFITTCFVDVMDMQSMAFTMSAPEFARNSAATAEIFRYLDLPYMAHLGCTDSPLFDQQAALDIATQIYAAVSAQSNLNFFLGYLESAMSSSLEALVYGDEVIGYCHRLLEPVAVNEEALAADVIAKVGPGGNFLGEEHTVRHFRENWMPRDVIRTSREKWEQEGALDLGARLNRRVCEILAVGPQHPLNEAVKAELDRIMATAEAALTEGR